MPALCWGQREGTVGAGRTGYAGTALRARKNRENYARATLAGAWTTRETRVRVRDTYARPARPARPAMTRGPARGGLKWAFVQKMLFNGAHSRLNVQSILQQGVHLVLRWARACRHVLALTAPEIKPSCTFKF